VRRLGLLLTLLIALLVPAAASAQDMSPNVKQIASLPEMRTAIAVNFIDDTMFVSTTTGLFAYSIAGETPELLSSLPMYIWENEDMDVDRKRKRVFISRDPRGFTSPATPGATFPFGAVHIIDVSNPHAMTQVGFFTLPAGHTSTCINDCDVLWTGGPYANAQTQPDFVGRPIYATDVTDPANPKPCPDPIDTGRNDGVTDYAHDVQVDSRGIAWVSGAGGIRGYWTSGTHLNPVTGNLEEATGCRPIPYAGSGTPEEATPSRFMHNSYREPDAGAAARKLSGAAAPVAAYAAAKPKKPKCSTKKGSKAARKKCARAKKCFAAKTKKARAKWCPKPKKAPVKVKPGAPAPKPVVISEPAALTPDRVLYGTEEALESACETSGRFVAYDLEGTFGGEGFKDIDKTKHRMKVLDTWTPENAEGADGCESAHYFASRGDGVFANAFYGQGVRFLDVSNPADIRQIGWWRPSGANTWAPYFYKGKVYVADNALGVVVLEFEGKAAKSATVKAPPLRGGVARGSAQRFSREWLGGLCPLPAAS
jgi:hypothetical protein